MSRGLGDVYRLLAIITVSNILRKYREICETAKEAFVKIYTC
ncbi:hypothetical protein ACQPU1_12460 [Clostridium paraputrificum]